MLRNVHLWLPTYIKNIVKTKLKSCNKTDNIKILFTICDHYEPYWNNADKKKAYERVKKWVDHYPTIATSHRDDYGNHPKHCFFYPEEEYDENLINLIGEICKNGLAETEIHLHHDNDTPEILKSTLIRFKKILHEKHGLLSRDKNSGEIKYGFIHGNWALDNSRPDGRYCGINDEITILQETGCYADFTMPSAPSDTQTKTINSIYYAIDDPNKPKSHDTGIPAEAGRTQHKGLLCLQGPLCLNLTHRKFGIIPRIENGCLANDIPMTAHRVQLWAKQKIHVRGRPDVIFIKLYCHGAQDDTIESFFKYDMLNTIYTLLREFCDANNHCLLYVSARQMYNIVKGLEADPHRLPENLRDFLLEINF